MTAQIDKEIADLQAQYENVQGSVTECYTRICGYYRPIHMFNRGRQEEYRKRKTFNIERFK